MATVWLALTKTRVKKYVPLFTGLIQITRALFVNLALREMLPYGELVPEESHELKDRIVNQTIVLAILIPVHHLYVTFVYMPVMIIAILYQNAAYLQIYEWLGSDVPTKFILISLTESLQNVAVIAFTTYFISK